MRVVSFNVNSIRVRMHQLEAVINKHQPEFIGLQETKVPDEEFPFDEIQALGYHAEFIGQKTHYGVALLSRTKPEKVDLGFPHDDDDSQKRFVCGQYNIDGQSFAVINGYFPQGEKRSHPTKFPAKEKYYADVFEYVSKNYSPDDNLIVMGDMNVAPLDTDIGIGDNNHKRWLRDGKTSFLPEEREWLAKITDWGMVDSFAKLASDDLEDRYSWFDYRSRGFERSPRRGLRIDLILASTGLAGRCADAGIDYDIRGMEKPSDHCPVWLELSQ